MAKVLRLHSDTYSAGSTISAWESSMVINDQAIDSIIDPQNNSSKSEITSIPSPFARMDLIKQAFLFVNNHGLDGDTIYHRMVSDCMDVGEIFFNCDKYKDCVKITSWNISEINNLIQCGGQAKLLGETLKLFIDRDKCYNLNKMQDIFILQYIGEGAPSVSALGNHIIGATSPCTMFFTPAGDLSYVSDHIMFDANNDRPFDGDFNPLYMRDREFIKYMAWMSAQPGFVMMYPEVATYITNTITKCNADDYNFGQELASVKTQQNLDLSQVCMDNGMIVNLPGNFPVLQKVVNKKSIAETSQFVINPSKNIAGILPLVLPIDQSCHGLVYTQSIWDGSLVDKVPAKDLAPLSNRVLPGVNTPYPYLTVGDFLEETLIHINYSSNSFIEGGEPDYLQLGNVDGLDNYLIPVKKEYFNFFYAADLRQSLKARKGSQDEIIVTLTIPIKGNGVIRSISYQRIYTKNDPTNERKFGKIVDINQTGVTVFPHVKLAENVDYRVTLYLAKKITDECPINEQPTLNFVDTSQPEVSIVSVKSPICRNQGDSGTVTDRNTIVSKTWKVDSPFDLIEIVFGTAKNLIIPLLTRKDGPKKFSFAVDFGTTNTHVEYSVDGLSEPKPLDTTKEDAQIRPMSGMFKQSTFTKVLGGDLMPVELGETSDVSFPLRTALTYQKRTDWGKEVIPLAQANIPFYYEKKSQPEYNEDPKTNLKWSKDSAAQAQTECFISNLAFIMRNKVVMNGGELSDTKVVWFYPTSMPVRVIGDLEKIWKTVYKNYFHGDEKNIISLPEAVAPLSYYRGATTDALTIDIGGGTSDFLFAVDKNVACISSARFASNSLFGDGLNGETMSNGFVKHFYPIIQAKLESYPELSGILERIQAGNNTSANLSSYFFSLRNNAAIVDEKEKENLDFNKMLADSAESSSVILLFYMSLIYYSARIMKAKGLKEPRHIGFSGNGSKVLNIFFDNSVSKDCIVEITKGIFEKVLGHDYDRDGLEILQPKGKSPKEATAKGGLGILKEINGGQNPYGPLFVDKHSLVWLGTEQDDIVSNDGKYHVNSDIDETAINSVVMSIEDFVKISKEVLQKNNASKYINMVDVNRMFSSDVFSRDLVKYIKDGRRSEKLQEGDEISSTLFFYPIEGILHKLAIDIFKEAK